MEEARSYLERIVVLDPKQIKHNSDFYGVHCDIHKQKIKMALSKYGQLRPIVVCKSKDPTFEYEIVEGGKILTALEEMGKKPFCMIIEDDKESLQLLRVILNERYFNRDFAELAELFTSIKSKYSMQEIANLTPYEVRDLKKLTSILEFDWEKFNESKIEGQLDIFM